MIIATADLILKDVVVVEGFYVNIISEACLYMLGVWYNGFDYLLCFGSEKENMVVKHLKCIYNLVFLKYKPLFTYSNTLFKI